jgi:hypothetical protein
MLCRDLKAGEPRPANLVRIRVPVKKRADFHYPKAGFRCPNKGCEVSVVLIEADTTTLPPPRLPRTMSDALCPLCATPLRLVGYYEIVELVPVESR